MDDALLRQRTYYARLELGLCTKCGMEREENSKYKLCAACRDRYREHQQQPERREWRKQYQKEYREEIKAMCTRIAMAVQQLIGGQELKSNQYNIDSAHKCWHCHWATWCGDRFFCPLAFTCIREKYQPVKEKNNGTKAVDSQ